MPINREERGQLEKQLIVKKQEQVRVAITLISMQDISSIILVLPVKIHFHMIGTLDLKHYLEVFLKV